MIVKGGFFLNEFFLRKVRIGLGGVWEGVSS